ncbi:MAG: hypothetical protein OHK0046_51930 [Anaerolineae bacterium]
MFRSTVVAVLILVLGVFLWNVPGQSQENNCSDAPPPRLVVGSRGQVAPGAANNLRDVPNTGGARVGQMPSGSTFAVLEGPVCADGFNWYQVEFNGAIAWTVEGTDGEYWLQPLEADAEATAIPTLAEGCTMPPRLVVGGQGRVLPGNANNFRDTPSASGTRLGQIPEGEVFLVLDGPICTEGFTWWQVDWSGFIGWTVEGANNRYSLEPVIAEPTATPIPAPSITPTPEPLTRPEVDYVNDVPVIGGRAVVIGTDNLNVRQEPRIGAGQVGRFEPGTSVEVVDGPVLAESFNWWEISGEDASGTTVTGWAVEAVLTPNGTFEPTLLPMCPYDTERLLLSEEGANLYTSNAEGGERCRLTYGEARRALWSPDGTMILYEDQEPGKDPEFFVMDANGDNPRQVTFNGNAKPYVTWSPDSTEIAYMFLRLDRLYAQIVISSVVDPGQVRTLTSSDTVKDALAWSAELNLIAYLEQTPNDGTTPASYRIMVVNPEVGEPQTLLETHQLQRLEGFMWLPNGTQIAAFARERSAGGANSGDSTVFLLDAAANEAAPVVTVPFRVLSWLAEPDGPRALITGVNADGYYVYHIWDGESIGEALFTTLGPAGLIGWAEDGAGLLRIRARSEELNELLLYDLATGEETVLSARPKRVIGVQPGQDN